MDAFALARIQARQTRGLLPAGIVSGPASVERAFADAGIEILDEDANGTMLGGSDAKLVRDASVVYVRDDIGAPERAQHLAHELGHLVMHKPHETCELHATDLRPAGSRALARVEAYGPRERRELMANVFGREFLLPRDLARELFLIQRLSASEIAVRMRLPAAMVRQQLSDALLRSEPAPSRPPAPRAADLDPTQDAAVGASERAVLVEAGPGSGKTKTLVAKVNRLLRTTHPSAILALTFSNKAAAELSTRIMEDKGDDAVEVWAGTFHAFGLEVLRRHYESAGLGPKIRLILPSQAVELLEDRLPLLGLEHFHDLRDPGSKLKELLRPIWRAKDELIGPQEFRRLAEEGLRHAQAAYNALPRKTKAALKPIEVAEKTLEAAAVYDAYDELLRGMRVLDFADLVMVPTLLMRREPTVLAELQDRHREILVDEYQDVNRASAEMVKLLWGEGNHLWAVGDARQSIYRFRGASPLNMERFEADFPGGVRRSLHFNYRSTEHVTSLCRTFAAAMDETLRQEGHGTARLPYVARARRTEEGSRTRLFVSQDDDRECDLLALEIRRLHEAGVPYGRQTVLSRNNVRLDSLSTRLGRHGIPALHLGSFFEREEVRDVLSILAIVAEPNGAALARVATFRGLEVEASDIALMVAAARRDERGLAEALPDAGAVPGLTPAGAEALADLGRRLYGMTPRTPAFEVAATWLLDRSDYLRDLAAEDGVAADLKRSALRQLLEFLDQVEPDSSPLSAQEALRRVRTVMLLADDRDLREPDLGDGVDAVRLMTVHAAKGLQFGAVHVVGLHAGGFPKAPRADQCQVPPGVGDGRDVARAQEEEERCCFFVAISRAEDHLRLYHTLQATKEERSPSPFIMEIGPFAPEDPGGAAVEFPATSRSVGPASSEVITLHDVRDFDKCPLRVAYRHHLSIRSRRHESPFLQTAGVIYALIDRLSEILGTGEAPRPSLEAAFSTTWAERGPPSDHPLGPQYQVLGRRDLERLLAIVDGHAGSGARETRLPIRGGFVSVPAPIIAIGATRARLVIAGKRDTKNARTLTTRLFLAAARFRVGSSTAVEVAHLRDGEVLPIVRSDGEVAADLEEAAAILDAVRAGRLEPKPNPQVCMRCGHFVSCPATGGRRGL